jgi:replicative DNA helicase
MKPIYPEYAEKSVLTSMLLIPDCIAEISTILNHTDFYEPSHSLLFMSMCEMNKKNKIVDLTTLATYLKAKGRLEKIGGIGFVANFTKGTVNIENAIYYSNIVRENSLLRKIRVRSQWLADNPEAEEREKWIADINQFEKMLPGDIAELKNLQEVLDETIAELDKDPFEEGLAGYPTGFTRLDHFISGIEKGKYYILAARPSTGKTALSLNIALKIIKQQVPVVFFSYETKNKSIGNRLISSELKILGNKLRSRNLTDDERKKIMFWKGRIEKNPFYFMDNHTADLAQIEKTVGEFHRKNKDFVLMVDYLQLIPGGRGDTREQRVASISKALRGITLRYDIPVIALSQLSRKVTNRGRGSKPNLADLRESGSLEQDADTVIFLHREQDIEVDKLYPIEVIIAKQRDGGLGEFNLLFDSSTVNFLNYHEGFENPEEEKDE